MNRCYSPNHRNFKNYGFKGIIVCEQWKIDRVKFFEWALSNGYKQGLTIDRIDHNFGYNPDNCRFVSMAENIQARSSITKLNPEKVRQVRNDFNEMTTREVAKKWGMCHRQIMDIKSRRAWSNVE